MQKIPVVLIRGDGIGPEIADAVVQIFDAADVPIEWIEKEAGLSCIPSCPSGLPEETIEAIRTYRVALKGPTTTPVGRGHRSVNVALRKALDLYANVRPARTLPGVPTRYPNIDLIVVRENVEDTYIGIEYFQTPDVAQGLKLISRPGSTKIVRYAFELARSLGRRRVVAVHKANIHKLTDGLFLECFREVAREYPDIEIGDLIVDNCSMQLVTRPEQFDVLVMPNLYGDIISDLCAGLVGGLGVAPGGNIGDHYAVFEAVHGSAPDIAGKGIANPTALLLSGLQLLRHLGLAMHALVIERALHRTLEEGIKTRDLGGTATTEAFTAAIIERLEIIQLPEEEQKTHPMNLGAIPLRYHRPAEVRCVGVDVFLEHPGATFPELPQQVGTLQFVALTNRGTRLSLDEPATVLLVDHYRARYQTADGSAVEDDHIVALLQQLTSSGIRWMHVEKLFELDGHKGFSTEG